MMMLNSSKSRKFLCLLLLLAGCTAQKISFPALPEVNDKTFNYDEMMREKQRTVEILNSKKSHQSPK